MNVVETFPALKDFEKKKKRIEDIAEAVCQLVRVWV